MTEEIVHWGTILEVVYRAAGGKRTSTVCGIPAEKNPQFCFWESRQDPRARGLITCPACIGMTPPLDKVPK